MYEGHHLPAVIVSSDTSSSVPMLYAPPPDFRLSLDQMVAAWLHAKHLRSQSTSTLIKYTRQIQAFRCDVLTPANIDLDGDPALIATLLQGWAAKPLPAEGKARASTIARQHRLESTGVGPVTYNMRITIVSSFYQYAIKRGWLPSNPANLVDRRNVQAQDYARPLDKEEVLQALERIDRSTARGKRDYALLLLAFMTGRRKAELGALRWGDILLDRRGQMTVIWRHCKGGKQMEDALASVTAAAILDYLHAIYGTDLTTLGEDTPLWVSFRTNSPYQMTSLPTESLRHIWMSRLGTTKVHTTRHTFAVTMEETGAKLSDIGARLGHNNLETTSRYMQRVHAAKNPFAEKLEQAYGASATPTGEPPMTKDRQIREAILAHPDLSHSAIAQLVGCNPSTISRRRQAMGLSHPRGSHQDSRPTASPSISVDKTGQHS